MKRLRYGRPLTILLLILILWGFAIIAGLSASVIRAVTMFSIIAIGMHLKRPTNIYNTLAISVFVLLLFKPLFLFDVGFQLSYLAVIAIVAVQPKLFQLWRPKSYLLAKTWGYFTVGVAAQFGVLPISLYHFHQFPGLFFVANIIIIPFLGIILGMGILVIVVALLNALPQWLIDIYGVIIKGMNVLMQGIADQESFLFKDISFTIYQLFAAYLFIIVVVQFGIKQNLKWLRYTLVSLLLLQGSYLFSKYKNSSHELTIFHKSRHTIIGKKTADALLVYSNLDSLQQFYNLNDYKVGNNIKTIKEKTLPSVLKLDNKQNLLIIDSLGAYQVKNFKPDYILLTQSPKVNMVRILNALKPKLIIADGSNYKSAIARWKLACKKQKTPFHYTGERGAFLFDLD
ncbi:ComEC/Rec2 family competence protein [Lacinutrix neustonica]|uniref:ComEC/Rec2 family competence protein n=1 Tax=Lacinutrix neustonica TaxID=2980107 RepID=A0A9E8SG69_9FLAO|nr:ComEC/Rec2 family competence protein [Lacinutrix neustonica]WAC01430.1 ComEC/Rec2 family competence protein [Lacinutrix neustonica]